jgi:hypothetical protein
MQHAIELFNHHKPLMRNSRPATGGTGSINRSSSALPAFISTSFD